METSERPMERLFLVSYVLLFENRQIAPEPCTVEVPHVIHIFVAHNKRLVVEYKTLAPFLRTPGTYMGTYGYVRVPERDLCAHGQPGPKVIGRLKGREWDKKK